MSKPKVGHFPFAKAVTVLAIALGIGLGLCGLSFVLPSSDDEFHTNWLSFVSLPIMALSALGLIITLVTWVITTIFGRITDPPKHGPQRLFDNTDEDTDDKDQQSPQ